MSGPTAVDKPLSPRLLDVLRLIARGYSLAQMCAELYLSENTIRTHRYRLYQTLGASGAAHAVAIGYERGLLLPATVEQARAERQRLQAAHTRDCGVFVPPRCTCPNRLRPPEIPGQLALPAR